MDAHHVLWGSPGMKCSLLVCIHPSTPHLCRPGGILSPGPWKYPAAPRIHPFPKAARSANKSYRVPSPMHLPPFLNQQAPISCLAIIHPSLQTPAIIHSSPAIIHPSLQTLVSLSHSPCLPSWHLSPFMKQLSMEGRRNIGFRPTGSHISASCLWW